MRLVVENYKKDMNQEIINLGFHLAIDMNWNYILDRL